MANTNLSVGSFESEVADLHRKLTQLGFAPPASEVARQFFGPGTREAVQQLQQRLGLPATGEVDAATSAALTTKLTEPAIPPTPVKPPPISPTTQPASPPAPGGTGGREGAAPKTVAGQVFWERGLPTTDITVRPYGAGFPAALGRGATGDTVATLHGALTTIGLPIDVEERDENVFGTSTGAAVRRLQALSGLKPTGVVDENTRTVITTALARFGVGSLDGGSTTGTAGQYTVDGHVTDVNGELLSNATVVAFDRYLRTSKELGRASTDVNGYYRITYAITAGDPGHTAPDLQMQVLNADGSVRFTSDITFNAPRETTINLPLGGPQRQQPSEFSWLHSTITPLLGGLAPTDLNETNQYRDLTFLAGATAIAKERIALWAIAARLSAQTDLRTELFYGLLRGNVAADARTTTLAGGAQGVDLAANAQRLLDTLLSASPAVLRGAVDSAIAADIIPASYAGEAKNDLARLTMLGSNAALTSPRGMGNTSIANVLNTLAVDSNVQQRFIQLYTAARGSARRTFWSDLSRDSAFTAAQVADLRFGMTVGRLTRGHLPLIAELASMRGAGSIKNGRDLARLTADDWKAILQRQRDGRPVGIPSNITAETPARADEVYAAMLERNFTNAYPTPAFSARLAKDARSPFAAKQAVARFLDANPAFDLLRTNVDAYAKQVPVSADVRATLLTAQRLGKLTPSYPAMSALLVDGVHSAQQVYHMGRDRFVAKYGQDPAIGAATAARMYGKAEQTYGMALALMMRFNMTLSAGSPAATGGMMTKELTTQLQEFPNLQTLFGSDSLCACQECQSVLGPAAYLVDMLEFLRHRPASGQYSDPTGVATRALLAKLLPSTDVDALMAILAGTSSLSTTAQGNLVSATLGAYLDPAAAQTHLVGAAALQAGEPRYEYVLQNISVRGMLLARRPDIAQIQLNCANTNTALPYIDLVNELLEDAVAPPADPIAAARGRQTTLTTPELNANPQYVNENAYTKLKAPAAVYPWTLPFDLPLAEARTYLGQLGLDRVQLVRTFQKPVGYPSAQARLIAVEILGFSAVEADTVAGGQLATANHSWDYWGLAQAGNSIVDPYDPSKTISGSWIDVLSRARVLLSRANLTYRELARLLNTRFINNDGAVTINCDPPDSCDVATMTVSGLTQDVLDRLHRFVRLWRRLGWIVYDLDDAIRSLQHASDGLPRLTDLNDQLLRQLAAVAMVAKRFNLPIRQVVAFFGTIPTRDIPTLPGDEVQRSLYHDLFENLTVLNPIDPVFTLNSDGTEIAAIGSHPKLADHSPALVAAFEISSSDLNLAIATFTDGNLTLADLSTIYRHVQLASVLGITLTELVKLLAIAEAPIDTPQHYERVFPFDGTRPEGLITFLDIVTMIRGSGLSVEQLDYILRHVYDDSSGVAPDRVAVGTLLLTVRNGLIKIAAETAFSPDPTGTATRKDLAKLLSPIDVDTAMAILSGTSALLPADQATFVSTKLGAYMDAASAQAKLVSAGALAAGGPRYEYVLHSILDYERGARGTGLVVQSLAQALGIATAAVALLVNDWFPSATTPGKHAINDFLALPSVVLADTSDPITPDTPGFGPYFSTYAALAKTGMLITSLTLSTDDAKWWRETGVGFGWVDPTTLPTSATVTAQGRFYSWNRLVTARTGRDSIPATNRSFRSLFGIAGGGTTKAQFFVQLAALTQWPADALKKLCGDPANLVDHGLLSLVYPDDFRSERGLSRLIPCFKMLKRTGIPADVSEWIGVTVTPSAADAIKQSVKANYPNERWLALAKQLRDGLRQNQRDALVAYLLANPPAGTGRWLDPDDVFARYLIDVEMGACQATSRIVQATAAVQLFVQRCFLNLEAAVKVDAKTDADWLRWRWMSQYRLWQANRKVFLFPENWIDPTLRSDKSSFFTELEQELKQSDLTNDAAETAVENYLEKLEAVARLDVCGTFHDLEEGKDVLHVIARTQGSPPIYYIREWVDSSRWTPWRKIDLDITSDHVLPVVWNGKLYLFWAIVNVKANQRNQPVPAPQPSPTPPVGPNLHLEVQLAWSQFKQHKWQAKQTAPQVLVFPGVTDSSSITLKSSISGSKLEIDVFVENDPGLRDPMGAFLLGGAGNGVEAFVPDWVMSGLSDVGPQTAGIGVLNLSLPELSPPTDGAFDGDWMKPDPSSQQFLTSARPRVGRLCTSYDLYGSLPSESVLQQADYYRLVIPHQIARFDSSLPFFYRDSARQYFCVPTIYFQNGNYFTINQPTDFYHPLYRPEYRFWPFYHAFVPLFVSELNRGGVDALFNRDLQLDPSSVAGNPPFDFLAYYQPSDTVLPLTDGKYPTESVDFAPNAGYAIYNWELFFHAPFLIAKLLSANQRFGEAKKWYEYIFNPTSGATEPVPQRYWTTKPFYNMTASDYAKQQIAALMRAINAHDPVLEHQVAEWRKNPFDPDLIAQLRPVAYQRAVVMKYIDNLIKWGDQLFAQDTMESINLATQLYVLAAALLGPRPQIVPPRVQPVVKTYADLEGNLDVFSNELVAAENAIPPVRVNVPVNGGGPNLPMLNMLYFRIPPNDKLLTYWDTVADRLFKIRHCMNIKGVVRPLPLFAPPIEPGLLIAAAAAGLDLGSVLLDINAALPPYRFTTMIRQAKEICEEVRGLGGALLSALEKGDAEALARVRSGAERQLQSVIGEVRQRQIDAAAQQIDVLAKSKQSFINRANFYTTRTLMNDWEAAALVLQGDSLDRQDAAFLLQATASLAHLLPDGQAGGAGAGGTPTVTAIWGGKHLGPAAETAAAAAHTLSAIRQTKAQIHSVLGGYYQRQDQWSLEGTIANDEMSRIDAETVAAGIHRDIARKEQSAQDIAMKEAGDVDDFLHTKFTSQELYDWMVGETSTTYFQAYQLAYSIAKQAEQCFRRELGIAGSNYIQFGYWDSLRKGLTAGDKLQYDLRRLETAYYTQNARELEITKHVSLAQLDPYALLELRNKGTCLVSLPELLFDLDNPGHYLRRLKAVGITVPCVVGPYGSVSLTLTLLDNHIRTSTDTSGGYPGTNFNTGFLNDAGGTSEIVTSSAQNDSGLFELRLEDERYLPFEGAGTISNWRITLNNVYPQFDYSTITDVVLHIRYTARDGGSVFASTVADAVKAQLNTIALAESRKGLYRMFSARHDYSTNWARFLNPGTGNDQVLALEMPPDRFAFFTYGMDIGIVGVDVLAKTVDTGDYTLVITPPGGTAQTVTFSAEAALNGVHHWSHRFAPKVDLGRAPTPSGTPPTWTIKLKKAVATDFRSLTAADLDDLVLIVAYQVS